MSLPTAPVPIEQLELDPAADNYAVFGNPVAHSKSPAIHHAFARATGHAIRYQAVLVPPGGFAAALEKFQSLGGRGLNVTLPFKGDACAAAHLPSARAARCGSVNTLWFDTAGRRHGETTDGMGLLRDLATQGMAVTGRRVLVLGAGGAVAGVLPDLLDAAPAMLVLANRTPARAVELVRRIDAATVRACGFADLAGSTFDLVVNGTAAGLAGELPALPAGVLAQGGAAYDMVYGPGARAFCEWARAAGAAHVSDGLGMLVEQAAESFRIWRGVRPDTAPVIAALRSGS